MANSDQRPNPFFENVPDYPIPDPTWFYATVYHNLHAAKQQLDETIAFISEFEKDCDEANEGLCDRLTAIENLWRDEYSRNYDSGE